MTYASEQRLSALLDTRLGLRVEECESALHARSSGRPSGDSAWIGLPSQTLLTPYRELRQILRDLGPPPGATIADLGAAYGRLGFLVGRLYPEVHFLGYEVVPERLEEGQRWLGLRNFSRVRLEARDLSVTPPDEADYYFIYDYGSREAVSRTLVDLKDVAVRRPIQVIGRGRLTRDLIERKQPWLSAVIPPVHRGRYSLYRSTA